MPKTKIPPEIKLQAVLEYLNGGGSIKTISEKYGVACTPFQKWLAKYKAFGHSAFTTTNQHTFYSTDFKWQVINAYLSGQGSYRKLAIKYKIPSENTLRAWVLKYNSHEELKASGTRGGHIMTKSRQTTLDERIAIVEYCIAHNHNYIQTAEKYQISYQQARNYTLKYEAKGIEALKDHRGKRKPIDEMSETDRLAAENKILKAKIKQAEMEISFLKKLEEIERRRD